MTVSIAPVREFLQITKEGALNTLIGSPVAGTDSIYIRLVDGNSFTMKAKPVVEKITYGGGFAVTAQTVSDHYTVSGNLRTKLYPTQAQLLLDWGLTRINAGQTLPWVTTENVGDLASCTIYHGYKMSDGSILRKTYSGVKVSSLGLDVSRDSTTAVINLGLEASKQVGFGTLTGDPDGTAFPAPTEADYPVISPYTFASSAGLLTIASARTQYRDLSIKVTNALAPEWFETAYRSIMPVYGRNSMLDTTLYLKASPDDRSAFEALTAKTVSLGFTGNSATLTFTFNGKNIIDEYALDLPLDKAFMAKLSLQNVWDPAGASGAGSDLTFAIA